MKKRPLTLPKPLKGRPGAWKPVKTVAPVKSAKPTAPTGNVERWLVTHRSTGGVLGVVWDYYWFGARERAEWFYKVPRDFLLVKKCPLLTAEKMIGEKLSGLEIAERLGKKMHVEHVVKSVDHANGVITLRRRCPATYTTHSRNTRTDVFCRLDVGHKGEHRGFRKRWRTKK